MNKSIELTQSQIKAKANGATCFLFFANNYRIESEFDECVFPLQKGDKNVWIKEEFQDSKYTGLIYKAQLENTSFLDDGMRPASQMQQRQSTDSFNEIIDVRVVRVQDILQSDVYKMLGNIEINEKIKHSVNFDKYYENQLKEQNINRTYDDNDYVFLVEAN